MRNRILFSLVLAALLLFAFQVSAQEKVQITLWHHWDGDRSEWVQKMLDDFMEQHPSIEVTQVLTSTAGAADKLTAFIMGGTTPEVVMVRSSYAQPLFMSGEFEPLDEMLTRDGIGLDIFVPADLRPFQVNGTTFGLPIMSGTAWTNIMFYNKRILEEAGLPARAPKTWKEWLAMSKRVTKRASDGTLEQAGSEMPPLSWVAPWNGAALWSDDWKTAQVNTPRVAETVDFLKQLLDGQYNSYREYTSFRGAYFDQAFYKDRQAFSVLNSSAFAHLPKYDMDWGAGAVPVSELHEGNQPMGLVLSSWSYAMPKHLDGAKREAAWELLKWLTTSQDAAGWFARIQGRPSPVLRFNGHPDYLKTNPYWGVVIETAQKSISAPPVSLGDVDSAMYYVTAEGQHPEQALENAELALQLKLNDLWQ